jgi:hypothetical protein
VQKILVIAIFVLVSPVIAEDLTTLKGQTYKKATVTRVEPDGIVVRHRVGVTKIPFSDLPKEWQEKYGYQARKDTPAPISGQAATDSWVVSFAPLGVSQAITEAAYGGAVGSEPGAKETEHGEEYHVGDFVIWVAFVNGASVWQHFQKTDKSEITKVEMERILEANVPLSEWTGPLKLTNGALGYASKSRQLVFALPS